MTVVVVAFFPIVAGILAAWACFSASKAHRRLAEVLREMARTWTAIETAQRRLGRGDLHGADLSLEAAAQEIAASRRRREGR